MTPISHPSHFKRCHPQCVFSCFIITNVIVLPRTWLQFMHVDDRCPNFNSWLDTASSLLSTYILDLVDVNTLMKIDVLDHHEINTSATFFVIILITFHMDRKRNEDICNGTNKKWPSFVSFFLRPFPSISLSLIN